MTDLREAQLSRELEADAAAVAARLRAVEELLETAPAETPKGSAFIARAASVVADRIREACEVAPVGSKARGRASGGPGRSWLRKLRPEVAAVIAVREVISACRDVWGDSHGALLPEITSRIGSMYETEVLVSEAEAVNPVYMQKIHKQIQENGTRSVSHIRRVYGVAYDRVMKGVIDSSLSRQEQMHLGKHGLQACIDAGIVEESRAVTVKGTSVFYKLSPDVEEFLSEYNSKDFERLVDASRGEMICPPDPWFSPFGGGYLSPRRKANCQLVRNGRRARRSIGTWVRENFRADTAEREFTAVNHLQSVAFCVHTPTLHAVQALWEAGGGPMGVPTRNSPRKPPFPLHETWDKDDATKEELAAFSAWKAGARRFYTDVKKWRSKTREIGGLLKALHRNSGQFWFPMFMDSRGRKYYRGVPNPQGTDIAKSCLHFSTKLPLGERGVFWLKVHIANSLGFDKGLFEKRAAYVDENWDRLVSALDNPKEEYAVFGNDAPWCAFAGVWELRAALSMADPSKYCTGIPIHMDATCSGLQHFSALLRDEIGGTYVNLTPSLTGVKQDIYARVAAAAMASMEQDVISGVVEPEIAAFWQSHGISRSLAKKPVMTFVYGAVMAEAANDIEDEIAAEVGWPAHLDPTRTSMYAARKLFAGIEATVPAACALMRWLKTIVRHGPKSRPIMWRTPTKFPVWHDYRKDTSVRLRINSCGVEKTLIRTFIDDIDTYRSANAISPNFVHAMDACHVTLIAEEFHKAGHDLVSIHDSIGCHPCNVDWMHRVIREKFVELYSDRGILSNFLMDCGIASEAPALGCLDLNQVLESEFFFC